MNPDKQHLLEYKKEYEKLSRGELHYESAPQLTSTPEQAIEFRKDIVTNLINQLEKTTS